VPVKKRLDRLFFCILFCGLPSEIGFSANIGQKGREKDEELWDN
jgi:hypothetical protein